MKALINNNKIIQIQETEFAVAEPLYWIDVTDAKVGDSYIDGQVVKLQETFITWEDIRAERDSLLKATDWHITYATEKNTSVPQNILDYRQALRDLPQTYQNPEDVVFPSL